MTITRAEIEDLANICSLVNKAYRGEASRKGWTTEVDLLDGVRIDEATLIDYLLDKDSKILKCSDNDVIIGCVHLKTQDDHLNMGMLTVEPVLQSKGLGKLLFNAAEKEAKAAGLRSIVITVITLRTELIGWYKRLGFKETGEKMPFPIDEKFGKPKTDLEFLVMEKTI